MSEETYTELKEIENRFFKIVKKDGVINSELGDIWSELYEYLEKVKPTKL